MVFATCVGRVYCSGRFDWFGVVLPLAALFFLPVDL